MESRDRLDRYCTSLAIVSSVPDFTSSETSYRCRISINTSTFSVDKNTIYSLLKTQKNHPQIPHLANGNFQFDCKFELSE